MYAPATLLIVPTYNERENLPVLVEALLAYPGWDVLVVDDGSPDGTGQVADGLAATAGGRLHVWHRTGKRGLGRSYRDAFQRALAEGWDVIGQMDADLSHDPKYLPAMVAATADHEVVIGSRYVHGVSVVNWPLRRIILSSFANAYIRTVTGLRVRDCTSGFRCWRREMLGRIPFERIVSEGYAFMVETLEAAVGHGARVHEEPIIFIERRQGQSKLSRKVLVESLVMPWRLRLGRLAGRRPRDAGPSARGRQAS